MAPAVAREGRDKTAQESVGLKDGRQIVVIAYVEAATARRADE